jgi:transposase
MFAADRREKNVSRSVLTNAELITLGVDTHKDIHVAVALDGLGRRLGTLSIPTTPAGYEVLVDWTNGFGPLGRAGVEGTGSFGAGLTRFLRAEGIEVFEVIRPRRRDQYRSGKSDPIDAEAAARAVLAGTATGVPKGTDGEVEMIRTLRAARRSAVKARAQAANQLRAMLITAPETLKSDLRGLSTAKLVTKVSRVRPGTNLADVEAATKFALRSVAPPPTALGRDLRARRATGSPGGTSRAAAARRGGR